MFSLIRASKAKIRAGTIKQKPTSFVPTAARKKRADPINQKKLFREKSVVKSCTIK